MTKHICIAAILCRYAAGVHRWWYYCSRCDGITCHAWLRRYAICEECDHVSVYEPF